MTKFQLKSPPFQTERDSFIQDIINHEAVPPPIPPKTTVLLNTVTRALWTFFFLKCVSFDSLSVTYFIVYSLTITLLTILYFTTFVLKLSFMYENTYK